MNGSSKSNGFSVLDVMLNATKTENALLRRRLTVHVARQGLIRRLAAEFQKQCNALPPGDHVRTATEQVLNMFVAVVDGKHDPVQLREAPKEPPK